MSTQRWLSDGKAFFNAKLLYRFSWQSEEELQAKHITDTGLWYCDHYIQLDPTQYDALLSWDSDRQTCSALQINIIYLEAVDLLAQEIKTDIATIVQERLAAMQTAAWPWMTIASVLQL